MNKKIMITNIQNKNNKEVYFELESSQSLDQFVAKGQMLVDSDGLSFIYLLEKEDDYTYVTIPEQFWDALKDVITYSIPVFVTNGKEKLLLTQFQEELDYLIENIKGNSNYGEKMMSKIEEVF